MKKLMTVIAAVGMAFGLFAESKLNNPWTADGKTATNWNQDELWSGATESVEIGTSGGDATPVIKFKTGSSALSRTVKAGGFDADGNVFFDTYIDLQGQALDELPTVDTSAKIALFALDNTDLVPVGTTPWTGFYALAQYGAAGQALFALGEDTVDIDVITNGLHRITIKAYDNVMSSGMTARPGFVCFIDGVDDTEKAKVLKVTHVYGITEGVVNWSTDLIDTNPSYLGLAATAIDVSAITRFNDKQLLLSLLDGAATFSAVDFIGTASVADITINDTGFDYLPDDVQAMMLSLANDVTVVAEPSAALVGSTIVAGCTLTASCEDTSKTVFVMGYNGTAANVTQNGNVFTIGDSEAGTMLSITAYPPVATVDGVGYETIAKAINAANTAGKKVTLSLAGAVDWPAAEAAFTGDVVLDLAGATLTVPNGAYLENKGTLEIQDSSVAGTGNIVGEVANYNILTVTSGIFNGGLTTTYETTAGVTTINGGTFNGVVSTVTDEFTPGEVKIIIQGGTFFDENATLVGDFYLNGYIDGSSYKVIAAGEDNYWTVVEKGPAVAKIGDDEYETLAEAFEAVQAGGKITVIGDTLVAGVRATNTQNNVTLDLNGKTLTHASDNKDYTMIVCGSLVITNGTIVKNNQTTMIKVGLKETGVDIPGTLTIVDATIDDQTATTGCALNIENGSATLKSGAIKTDGHTEDKYETVRVKSGCSFTMEGGEVVSDKIAINIQEGATAVSISGGEITGTISNAAELTEFISGGKFSVEPTAAWIADGKKAKLNSGWYEIVAIQYATLRLDIDANVTSYTITDGLADGSTVDIDDAKIVTASNFVFATGYEIDNDKSTLSVGPMTEVKDYTIKVVAKKTQSDPVVPGDDIKTDKTPAEINTDPTLKEQLLKAPVGVETTKDYLDLFKAVDGTEPGTVKFVLTEDAEATLATEVANETKAIEVAKIADGTVTTIAIENATKGLYYTLNAAATLEGIAAVDEVLCTDGTVTFTTGVAPTKGDTARFFKVSVSATPAAE